MIRLFLATFLIAPCLLSAQPDSGLKGSWQEVKRTSGKKEISFQDTVKLSFLPENNYTWHKAGSFIYKGSFIYEQGSLDLGMRIFKVIRFDEHSLVLEDESGVYDFRPYAEPVRGRFAEAPSPEPVTDFRKVSGLWRVFKRTSEKPLQSVDYTTLIKSIAIYEQPDDSGSLGYVSGGRDPKGVPSWKITQLQNGQLECTGKSQRNISILGGGKELVLKEGEVTYFLKQFND